MCENYTLRESYSNAYVSKLLSCEWKPHFASGNRTLRLEVNLVRVEITLVRVRIAFVPIEITLRVEITLCL
jgi:hypothetical protein